LNVRHIRLHKGRWRWPALIYRNMQEPQLPEMLARRRKTRVSPLDPCSPWRYRPAGTHRPRPVSDELAPPHDQPSRSNAEYHIVDQPMHHGKNGAADDDYGSN
jgi:hypothetical protein